MRPEANSTLPAPTRLRESCFHSWMPTLSQEWQHHRLGLKRPVRLRQPLIGLALEQLAGYSHTMGDEAGPRGVRPQLVSLAGGEIKSLANAMFSVPTMRSPNSRQQVLEFVKERNTGFNPHRSDVDTTEISNFIRACQADEESFDLLLEAIEARTSPDDPDLLRLRTLAAELLPRALVTAHELRQMLALKPSTVSGPDVLAFGMQIAMYGHTGDGYRGRKPANARKAMHLLLDNPSPEVGLRRLLRFADWLAEFASVAEHDPSIARRLRELAVHVGRAHGMLPEQWQVSIEATPQDTVDAATQTGLQQPSREDPGGRGGSPYQGRKSPSTQGARNPRARDGRGERPENTAIPRRRQRWCAHNLEPVRSDPCGI